MPAVHNARITLLATAANNLAMAVVVSGCIAPAASGQLHGGARGLTTFAWIAFGIVLHIDAAGPREVLVMTWDQVWTWLIIPAIGTIVIAGGVVWASRRIP